MPRYLQNRFVAPRPNWHRSLTVPFTDADPLTFHRTLPGYYPTPLLPLDSLAAKLGLESIHVKDENHRLGLNAFKVLGASYAIYRFLRQRWENETGEPFGESLTMTESQRNLFGDTVFCTATDGNHGRAVAWTASRLGLKAVIYMPRNTVPARIENIRELGATVEVIDGDYDDAVERIRADADTRGWQMISDTSWPGYHRIPGWIQSAYTTMFAEMEDFIHASNDPGVDVVIVPGGVGALAAGAAWYYVARYGSNRPKLISVEPSESACLFESAATTDGTSVAASGQLNSIMAGLNCGVPSEIAWPIIRDSFHGFITIEDSHAKAAMRRYYHPIPADPQIISGESGAAALGALLALTGDDSMKKTGEGPTLDRSTRVLLLNTEGATDPAGFQSVVGGET